jgi:predicted 3-demethylubiquinone-9 3-methyltransferase (glyoxalase superfamily)
VAGMNNISIQKITPHLWFDNNAEEAAKFYTTIFDNSKIIHIARYGDAAAKVSGRPKGSVMTVVFELVGQRFMALNGGPIFKFSPAISFLVSCETQEEIDNLWEKLSEGGEKEQCGWLKDKFGVSWQIVPNILGEMMMMQDKDDKKTERAMEAMLQMKKINIEPLKKAYAGGNDEI